MAVTSIWAIKGTESAIQRVETYIENPDKTRLKGVSDYQRNLHRMETVKGMACEFTKEELLSEERCYVSGINCSAPENAHSEFADAYALWEKPCKGRVCYHGYQSFREGEVTAEQAHEIGVKLAETLWGDRFQVVVATHLNAGHVHNHFLLNAVSFVDGRKYINSKEDYQNMRKASDAICREYGLSVIENLYGGIKADLDDAVFQSDTVQELIAYMQKKGYTWNFYGKYAKLKPPGRDRYVRLKSLKEGYDSLETLARRVLQMQEKQKNGIQMPSMHYRSYRRYRVKKKAKGFLALYYYHCYRIGVFARKKSPHHTAEQKAAQKQLHQLVKSTIFLHDAGIRTQEQFAAYLENLQAEMADCIQQITHIQKQLVQSGDVQENRELVQKLETLHQVQSELQEKQAFCRMVEQAQKADHNELEQS